MFLMNMGGAVIISTGRRWILISASTPAFPQPAGQLARPGKDLYLPGSEGIRPLDSPPALSLVKTSSLIVKPTKSYYTSLC